MLFKPMFLLSNRQKRLHMPAIHSSFLLSFLLSLPQIPHPLPRLGMTHVGRPKMPRQTKIVLARSSLLHLFYFYWGFSSEEQTTPCVPRLILASTLTY